MKNLMVTFIIFLIGLSALSQSNLEFSQYMGLNDAGLYHFGPRNEFPQNLISEDFGPRTPHNVGFHGGVDYNSRGAGDQDHWITKLEV